MEWRYARNSHPEQAYTSVLTRKLSQSQRPVLRQIADNSLSIAKKMKKTSSCDYRHHPVCRGYKSGNRCIHGYRCLYRQADSKSNLSARLRREYSRNSCYSEKKMSKVVYLKAQIQWLLFYWILKNWDWTLRRDTPEILRMHLVQNWIRKTKGQSGESNQKREPHERNPSAPISEEQPPEETTLQEDCDSKAAWNLATKVASWSRTLDYVLFSCEGAKDTEDRMFTVSSGASMQNAEQGELSSDTMDTVRRSKTPFATYRDWETVQINE